MFFLWTLLPALYVSWRLFWCLPCRVSVRIGFSLLAILGCEFHFITWLVSGNMFSPELPLWMMLGLGWWFGTLVILACALMLRDIVFLMLSRKGAINHSGVVLLALAMLTSVVGVRNAVQDPNVRSVELSLPALPVGFEGYRIVQLTDIHTSSLLRRDWLERVVSRSNALDADLMVLTGDLSDGLLSRRKNDIAPLSRLRAKDGVYATTGNHEYYFDYSAWMQAFNALDIPFLLNSHVRLSRGGDSLILAGVTDEAAIRVGEEGPDIAKALTGVGAHEAMILLDHRPGHAERNAVHGVMLQLSGHTHGGMIRGLDQAIKPANGGFISGYYPVGNMALYVSNGAGLWNGFPLRLGRPAEITQLILRRGPAGILHSHSTHHIE